MQVSKEWAVWKRNAMKRLEEELEKGRVDREIIPLLEAINSIEHYATLSSCAGRIAVIDVPHFGSKKDCTFLGKWHERVSTEDVLKAISLSRKECWFVAQPAILHVMCSTLEHASRLLNVARNSGFRESGIISLKKNIVRICSSERIEAVVAVNGKTLAPESYIHVLVDYANKKLEKTREKLRALEREIRCSLC
jgi:tRNA wybutosine-synthesizing protein 3